MTRRTVAITFAALLFVVGPGVQGAVATTAATCDYDCGALDDRAPEGGVSELRWRVDRSLGSTWWVSVQAYDGLTSVARTNARLRGELIAPRAIATGQEHHVISRRIAAALDDHPTLAGQYTARDPRFVTRAADAAAHRGYQRWHRQLDAEVVDWLARNPNATMSQFERFLQGRYGQQDLLERFPNGF